MISPEDFKLAIEAVNSLIRTMELMVNDIEAEGIPEDIFSEETADSIESTGNLIKELRKRADENYERIFGARRCDA